VRLLDRKGRKVRIRVLGSVYGFRVWVRVKCRVRVNGLWLGLVLVCDVLPSAELFGFERWPPFSSSPTGTSTKTCMHQRKGTGVGIGMCKGKGTGKGRSYYENER